METSKEISASIDSVIQKLSETAINKLKYKSWLHRAAFLELPKPSAAFSASGVSGYKEYEAIINTVPLDCCSPTQLLNGILEQVSCMIITMQI
jgi:hypothetical protein